MPYQNEHACRIRDPADFRRGSFRRVRRKSGARPLDAVMGRLDEDGSAMVLQSYRYPKDDWSSSQARRHCRDHEGALFEPAKQSGRGAECEPCKGDQPMGKEQIVSSREVVIERRESPDEGAYRATIFVNARARHGPALSVEGLQVANYMRNPVVLWAHDMNGKSESAGLPVGRTNRLTNVDGRLEVDFEFLTEDPFAERVRNAWDKGFLKAASVSWLPLESEEGEDGNQRDVRSDLLEWSIVSVPSDPDAVRVAHARMMETMLTEPISDEEVFAEYSREEVEETVETTPSKRQAEPCWEVNEDCSIRKAMDEAAEEESEETEEEPAPEAEAASVEDTGRLLKELAEIKSRLRGN